MVQVIFGFVNSFGIHINYYLLVLRVSTIVKKYWCQDFDFFAQRHVSWHFIYWEITPSD